jgi:hypothetical protein
LDQIRINRWLTLGANLGVLVGIALLVFELNQNREMVKAQTRHDISTEYSSFLTDTAYSPETVDIILRKVAGAETTPQEDLQYQFRLIAWFEIASNVHYQYRQGLYDESEWSAITARWRGFANASPSVAEHWCRFRSQQTLEFQAAINPLFQKLDC